MNSEILNVFDENRNQFKPYGLTCELWAPNLMKTPDRHNEIEINYFSEGSITYLFHGKKITIPAKRLAVFWGLIPHQIVHYEGNAPYFVCTIPFSRFLAWKLPDAFVDSILQGEVLMEALPASAFYDEYLLKGWIRDIKNKALEEVILLELQARLNRMALSNLPTGTKDYTPIYPNEISQVEKIAIYIAQNYTKRIKISDIAEAVDLHPDYANAIFKKAFGTTLSEHITSERISHAQRSLVATSNSITAIAYECGFNSISRFNSAFLKINGCTPREYRKRYR